MSSRHLAAWLIGGAALLSSSSLSAAEGYRPQVGHLHGDLTLPSLSDGAPKSLSEFRGRKVLLIHFASW